MGWRGWLGENASLAHTFFEAQQHCLQGMPPGYVGIHKRPCLQAHTRTHTSAVASSRAGSRGCHCCHSKCSVQYVMAQHTQGQRDSGRPASAAGALLPAPSPALLPPPAAPPPASAGCNAGAPPFSIRAMSACSCCTCSSSGRGGSCGLLRLARASSTASCHAVRSTDGSEGREGGGTCCCCCCCCEGAPPPCCSSRLLSLPPGPTDAVCTGVPHLHMRWGVRIGLHALRTSANTCTHARTHARRHRSRASTRRQLLRRRRPSPGASARRHISGIWRSCRRGRRRWWRRRRRWPRRCGMHRTTTGKGGGSMKNHRWEVQVEVKAGRFFWTLLWVP